ncbi:PEP-CTERM sorting domain-containing protein, partial [Ectothiorhodospira sp. PHS-1]|uniref:PEP-CTERM sorting domain-containing protein n=1 Tax=Ectothiorhodospira sp. PHS-1 TaxID=519989 RepID=UPI001145A9AF
GDTPGFGVKSAQFGLVGNNNTEDAGGEIGTVSGPTDTSAGSGFENHVTWSGTYGGFFDISHQYLFNNDYERIDILTTFNALVDLSELKFVRAIDPDPDVNTHGSFDTINSRGADGVPAEDFVNSQGPQTGLTLGLYSNSSVPHNTGISLAWSTDPDFYLAGNDDGNGDNVIGLAFNIGTLLAGDSVVLSYSYVMGETLASVDLPDNPVVGVPVPGTLFLFGLGMLGILSARRRIVSVAY